MVQWVVLAPLCTTHTLLLVIWKTSSLLTQDMVTEGMITHDHIGCHQVHPSSSGWCTCCRLHLMRNSICNGIDSFSMNCAPVNSQWYQYHITQAQIYAYMYTEPCCWREMQLRPNWQPGWTVFPLWCWKVFTRSCRGVLESGHNSLHCLHGYAYMSSKRCQADGAHRLLHQFRSY